MAGTSRITETPLLQHPLKRMTQFCVNPLHIRMMRMQHVAGVPSVAERSLAHVMKPDDLKMLMWNIGNGLLDPVDKPRIFYLYGQGGEGTSTTIDTLIKNLPGVVHSLSRDCAGSQKGRIETMDVVGMLTNRFVSYGDVGSTNSVVNAQFWKTMTGSDRITTLTIGGNVSCVGLFAGNGLWCAKSSMQQK